MTCRLILMSFVTLSLASSLATAQVPKSKRGSGQPVGTSIEFNLDAGPDAIAFSLVIGRTGEPSRVMTDYQKSSIIRWTPLDEGVYDVTGRALYKDGSEKFATIPYEITSVTGGPLVAPVVSPTPLPLVALYSAPACPDGAEMVVHFTTGDPVTDTSTNARACDPQYSMNFYLGGMRAESTYFIQHELRDADTGQTIGFGQQSSFTTGSISPIVPAASVLTPATPQSSFIDKVILHSPVIGNPQGPIFPLPYAADIAGAVIWYNDRLAGGTLVRPAGNGLFLYIMDSENGGRDLVIFDLAGNIQRSTNIDTINRQLTAMGEDIISDMHHDIRPLPNGRIAALGTVERILTDVQGPGDINVLGDSIVVLDQNLQVEWYWNSFDHLDVTREAVLGETCEDGSGGRGCFQFFLAPTANDWTHGNTITYHATDGNLLISLRHQDWITKIDYRDGAGDGHVVWHLGNDGDFEINSPFPFPFPWFSHQHDPNFANATDLVVYDNSNVYCVSFGEELCNARGRVYRLDEQNMVATLIHDVDLLVESLAVGSSHLLSNGNYFFSSGLADGDQSYRSVVHETAGSGFIINEHEQTTAVYRSHRLPSLYSALPDLSGLPLPVARERKKSRRTR